ncbi:MAG: lipopolysaccharide biosynthesis protein [Oleiphilaceae bacterium]|nr:lipopolysaccharide biosynthesis protein [Oleiphilaceae bacterium]
MLSKKSGTLASVIQDTGSDTHQIGEALKTGGNATINDRLFSIDHLIGDLNRRTVRGGVLTLAAQGIKFILQMVSTIVLARYLSPADFGLVAMVTAVTGFVMLFKDAGLSMATVQREEITHSQISALFWINVAISIGLMILTACLAPAIARLYNEPQLHGITFAIAATFIFGGLSVQHQALLRRQMQFRLLALIDIAAMLTGVGAAIIIGVLTRSYWALVAMPAGIVIATCLGVWIACPWIPGAPRRAKGLRPMLKFGSMLTGFSVINYFARNVDNILTGWWLGASALGLYSKAYGLLLLPINQINAPFSNVMIPALSRLQNNPEAFQKLYMQMIGGIAWLGMPAITILALHADSIIRLVLGNQWLAAVPVFQLLTPAALMATTNVAGSWAVVPIGRADKQLKLSLVTSPCFVLAVCVGLPFGIEGVAISVSVSRVLLKLPSLAYCYSGTALRVRDFLAAITYPTIVCVCLALVHFPLLSLLGQDARNSHVMVFVIQLVLIALCFTLSSGPRALMAVGRKQVPVA